MAVVPFSLLSEEFLELTGRLNGLKIRQVSRRDSRRVYDGHIMAASCVLDSSVLFSGLFMQQFLIPPQTM